MSGSPKFAPPTSARASGTANLPIQRVWWPVSCSSRAQNMKNKELILNHFFISLTTLGEFGSKQCAVLPLLFPCGLQETGAHTAGALNHINPKP